MPNASPLPSELRPALARLLHALHHLLIVPRPSFEARSAAKYAFSRFMDALPLPSEPRQPRN